MNNEVEARSQRRRIALMVMASAFLVWQIPAMHFFDGVTGGSKQLMSLVSGAGFLVWAGALVVLLITRRAAARSDSPAVMSALEDELVRSNRSKAFVAGYMVTLATASVVFAFSLFVALAGIDAARLILVVAVITPLFAFAVLEGKNA